METKETDVAVGQVWRWKRREYPRQPLKFRIVNVLPNRALIHTCLAIQNRWLPTTLIQMRAERLS